MIEGTETAVNIQRHPCCPFQESRIMSAEASSGTRSAMSQFTICAAKIPMTIVNWLSETSRPRQGAGLTSAMYVGETLMRSDGNSTHNPPKNKAEESIRPPVSSEEIAKRIAEMINNSSAKAIAHLTGNQRTKKTADQGRTVRPSD